MLDPTDLAMTAAIARLGNLSAAARELGLSHSTVFRRLVALEKRCGLALFQRQGGSYQVTAAGQRVCDLALRWADDLSVLARDLTANSADVVGPVRITVTEDVAVALLPQWLAAVQARHPMLKLDVMVGNRLMQLDKGQADVAVRPTRKPPPGLVGKDLGAFGSAVYACIAAIDADADVDADAAGSSSRLPSRPPGDIACLADQRWLVWSAADGPQADQRWLSEHVAADQVVARFSSFAAYQAALCAGLGVGLLPCAVGDAEPRLVRLTQPLPALGSRLWALCTPQVRRNPAIRAVFAAIHAIKPRSGPAR